MRPLVMLLVALASACAADLDYGQHRAQLAAECEALLDNATPVDVEHDYVPRVLACENNEASTEGHKALAVAIRSLLYYQVEKYGFVSSGVQVYYCGRDPSAEHVAAAEATAGEVLRYTYPGEEQIQIYGFHVAGQFGDVPDCVGMTGENKAEWAVTYNEGKTGADVEKTGLGGAVPENRGAMSQNGSSCLGTAGRSYDEILRYYYGADIEIERAEGECVPAQPPEDEPNGSQDDEGDGDDSGDGEEDPQPDPDPGEPMSPGLQGGCTVAAGTGGDQSAWLLIALVLAATATRRGCKAARRSGKP